MNEYTCFVDALAECYGQPLVTLQRLNWYGTQVEAPEYQQYRVERPAGEPWVLFAYHDTFAQWPTFSWSNTQPLVTWLRLRASLLSHLARLHYSAPRVQPDCKGWGVTRYRCWNILVTTYVEGQANILSLDAIKLLASALGQLHQIDSHPPRSLGLSWWNTSYSIPHALGQLSAASASIPAFYRELYDNMQKTFHFIQQQLRVLPEVIIHGDCWPQNAVLTEKAQVVLIDWECAGRGAAILDLGALLLTCQCDQHGDFPSEIDETRIVAAVKSYARWRYPSLQEQDVLLEAIRFWSCWRGAWLFTRLAKEGWTSRIEPLLQRIQHAYLLAEPTAHLAQISFKKE